MPWPNGPRRFGQFLVIASLERAHADEHRATLRTAVQALTEQVTKLNVQIARLSGVLEGREHGTDD